MNPTQHDSANQIEPQPTPTAIQQPFSAQQQQPSRKRLVWIAASAVALFIIAGVGILLHTRGASADYDKILPAYEQRVQKAYDALDKQPADTSAYRTYLQNNITAFNSTVKSAPKQPTFVGFALGSSETKDRVTELTNTAQKTSSAMQEYLAFMVYRDSLLEIIEDNAGKISTVDDLRTFKTKLEANNKKIDNLKPPKGLESYAQEKSQVYKDMLADLTGALTAYEASKLSEYTTHVTQLAADAKRISVRQVGNELLDNHMYYNSFIKAAKDLDTLLKQ